MKKRHLRDLEVSAVGMGCMGFTHAYGQMPEEREGIRLVHRAFELGCDFFDTAEMYSCFRNEEFLGKAIKGLPRDRVIISDKFWPTHLPGQDETIPKLSEAGIRKALEASLKRLGTDYIDLYTEHQMEDGSEEEVAAVMGKLVREGKIRAWGQSSPSVDQIRKAHAVTPITAIQSEYSMMERKWEKDVLPLCRELGIGFVAFAPMGNGFLSGSIRAAGPLKRTTCAASSPAFPRRTCAQTSPCSISWAALRPKRAAPWPRLDLPGCSRDGILSCPFRACERRSALSRIWVRPTSSSPTTSMPA